MHISPTTTDDGSEQPETQHSDGTSGGCRCKLKFRLPAGPPPAAKDLTHVLTKDEPFFASEPTPGAAPSGTLKSGSKVLVLIPGAEYSQVITDTGVSAYTFTDGLKPLGK